MYSTVAAVKHESVRCSAAQRVRVIGYSVRHNHQLSAAILSRRICDVQALLIVVGVRIRSALEKDLRHEECYDTPRVLAESFRHPSRLSRSL